MPALTEKQLERVARRSVRRCSNFDDVELPALPDAPGMISLAERRYLYWLAAEGYAGAGAVVEVGTWLGLSTIHIGAGLRDAGYHDALHCYDRFVWMPGHSAKAPLRLRLGSSFQAHFERNVRPIYPGVGVTRCDLSEARWEGGPIEILVVDAPKHLPAISDLFAAFGPHLLPDSSLIVFQDYTHFPSYAIAAVLSTLENELELVHVVESGGIVSFRVRRPLDVGRAQSVDWNFSRWTKARAVEAWNRVLEPLGSWGRWRLEPGLALLLHDSGEVEAACDYIRRLSFNDRMTRRWLKFASSSLYLRYKPLFRARGVTPGLRDRLRLLPQEVFRALPAPLRSRLGRRLRAIIDGKERRSLLH